MRIELFDYELPEELIAQEPAARRDASRLLVIERAGVEPPREYRFHDLPRLLRAGDLLVLNDARVDPVRLHARRPTGGAVEVLLLRPINASEPGTSWEALMRPSKRLRRGERLLLEDGVTSLEVGERIEGGRRVVRLPADSPADELLDRWGHMPLPPYIRRGTDDERESLDRTRYQTVYARAGGAIAAPTAGLHFTPELLETLAAVGIGCARLTLRVGPGTFQPVRVDEVDQHRMEAEPYRLPQDCVDAIVATQHRGGRVIGVGTTVVRTLEHAARRHGSIEAAGGDGDADIFIYPGFEFAVVDGMLTNFHLPRSTPILMAAAMAGRERLLRAYRLAVEKRFRFYSYGDAMLIVDP